MKKLVTVLAVIAFGFGANAQDYKPSKGTVTTEVGLTGGLNNTDFSLANGNVGTAPMLRFRYFLKDNLGLRIGFSATRTANEGTPTSTITTAPVATPPPANPTSTTTFSRTNSFDMNIGVEKHFKGSERLSTFLGADLVFGTSGNNFEITENPSGDSSKIQNFNGLITYPNVGGNSATIPLVGTPKVAESYFGLRFITGADYYIAKKLYLGVEIGLAFVSTSQKKATASFQKTIANVVNTSEITLSPDSSGFEMSPRLSGGVRIGYQF